MTITDPNLPKASFKVITASIKLASLRKEYLGDQASLANQVDDSILLKEVNKEYRGSADEFHADIENDKVVLQWSIQKSPSEAEKLNLDALKLARAKKFEQAIALWKQAISLNSKDPDFQYNMGLAHLELKHFKQGLDRCLEVVRICPVYYRAYFVLGSIYSKLRQFEDSQLYLKKGLLFQDNNVLALVNLGAVYSVLRKYEEAIMTFEKAIALSPKEIKAYLGLGKLYAAIGDADNANRYFKAVIKLDPEGKLGNIARRSLQTVDIMDSSTTTAETLSKDDIANPDELYAKGYRHYIQGDFEDAINLYKKYLSVKESDADVWASLATCQLRMGRSQDAVASIRRAIKLRPGKAAFYKQAAIIYDAVGQDDDIFVAAQKAIELGKRDSVTLTLLGKSYVHKNDYQQGMKYLQDAIELNPNNLKAHFYYAQTLVKVGKLEQAKQHFEEILWAKIESPLKDKVRSELSHLS